MFTGNKVLGMGQGGKSKDYANKGEKRKEGKGEKRNRRNGENPDVPNDQSPEGNWQRNL